MGACGIRARAAPDAHSDLTASTFNAVARARAALGSLNSSALRLPNPTLLRRPALRREAQTTSALEGTYAPLRAVLAAGEQDETADANLREVLNYVRTAEHAFAWHHDGRPLVVNLLTELHGTLVRGTSADTDQAGRLWSIQVVVGGHPESRVQDARFVPRPPGDGLLMSVSTVGDWGGWVTFFAEGIAASARATEDQLLDLLAVQGELKATVRLAGLRADNAMLLVDFTLAQPIFTVSEVQGHLGVTYARANGLVGQLVDIGVLRQFDDAVYSRRFTAPDVLAILLRGA